jgi:tRNA modification GTPase
MTLTQAEALGGLLEAKNHRQMILSRAGVSGVLSKKIESLYSQMTDVLSSIYAKIDFPDEDLGDMGRDEIEETLVRIRDEQAKLAATYKMGKAVGEGVRTVICGRTNAGKSSLYNLIVGREAAIVTDIEGTTRDILEETVSFGGVTLRLCDTAGLRETEDKVESIGVERAKGEIREAEMILAVFDGTREPDTDDERLVKELLDSSANVIAVLNKSDLDNGSKGMTELLARFGFSSPVRMSAKNGEGREELSKEIERRFIDGSIDIKYDAVVADARQYSALIRSIERLDGAINAIRDGFALDLCCIDAEGAMSELGEINGRNVSEDIVGAIFSRFCVGK